MSTATEQSPASPAAAQTTTDQERESVLDKVLAATAARGLITMTATGIDFGNFEGVQRYAAVMVRAGMVPASKDDNYDSLVAKAVISILLGRKVGLTPEDAVVSIYVVNSRPQLFGDAPLAVCRQHPLWVESGFREWFEVDGKPFTVVGPDGKQHASTPPPEAFKKDTTAAVCQTLRKGADEPKVLSFSIAHAKTAGLFGRNEKLYGGYPQRMIMFRARGYNLRDNFGDALKGLGIRELAEPDESAQPAMTPTERVNQALHGNGNGAKADPIEAAHQTDAPSPEGPSVQVERPPVAETKNGNAVQEDQGGLADDIAEAEEAIDTAQVKAQFDETGAWLTKQRGRIGEEEHSRLLKRWQARYAAVFPQTGRKAKDRTF